MTQKIVNERKLLLLYVYHPWLRNTLDYLYRIKRGSVHHTACYLPLLCPSISLRRNLSLIYTLRTNSFLNPAHLSSFIYFYLKS